MAARSPATTVDVEPGHGSGLVRTGPGAATTAGPAARRAAEIRAYGESPVIAEQVPAELIPDVIKKNL